MKLSIRIDHYKGADDRSIVVAMLLALCAWQPAMADYKTSSGYPTAGEYPTAKGYPTRSSPTAHKFFTRQSPTAAQWKGNYMQKPKKTNMHLLHPKTNKLKTEQANVQSGTANAKKFKMPLGHANQTATAESTAMAAGKKDGGGFHVPFLHSKNSTANSESSSMASGNKKSFLPGHQQKMATDDLQSAILKKDEQPAKKPFQFPLFHAKNTTASSASSDMAKPNKGPFHWPGQKSNNSSASEDSTRMASTKQKKSWFHLPSLKKSNDGSLGASPGIAPNNNSL